MQRESAMMVHGGGPEMDDDDDETERIEVVRMILYDLNAAIAPREHRLWTIRAALEEFHHDDEALHDLELELNADKVIFQKLTFAFFVNNDAVQMSIKKRSSPVNNSQSSTIPYEEVALLCSALEMVYRASRDRVAQSFAELGETALLLFVKLLQSPAPAKKTKPSVSTALVPAVSQSPHRLDVAPTGRDEDRQSSGMSEEKTDPPTNPTQSSTANGDNEDDDEEDEDVAKRYTQSFQQQDRTSQEGGGEDDDANLFVANADDYGPNNPQDEDGAEEERVGSSGVENSGQINNESEEKHRIDLDDREGDEGVDKENNSKLMKDGHHFQVLAVNKTVRILRYYSRVLSAMVSMAHHPGFLSALMSQLDPLAAEDTDINDTTSLLMAASRVDAVATLVNLACAEENKVMMVNHPGLLDSIVNMANNDPSEEAREHAAIALMNLAYAEDNKVPMGENPNVLDTLMKLITDESPFTRRYASAAIFTLACVGSNTTFMAKHADGQILTSLSQMLRADPIDEARINAAEALFNMSRNDDSETVRQIGAHPEMLDALAHAVVTDYSADVRAYAARTLEWLAADIHHPTPCHSTLLNALITASQWTKTTCIAEAFKTQATLQENRVVMVQHPGLLDTLTALASMESLNDEEVRCAAIAAIGMLSSESSTRGIMAAHEGIMTALTKATFNASALDANEGGGNRRAGSRSAVSLSKVALKNLAETL